MRERKDAVKPYRLILLGLVLVTGCQNTIGPFQRRTPERVDDPMVSIKEQQRRGRDRLALWDDATGLAPKTYADRADPVGR